MARVTLSNNGLVLGLVAAVLALATWILERHVVELADAPRIVQVSDSRDDTDSEDDATPSAGIEADQDSEPTIRAIE
ncbi:MAG: hypothetical protein P8Y95_14855, partial [Gammaproteobacteria bacterium]